MKRALRWAARLYPRRWRMRYGAEFDALLDEAHPDARALHDVLMGAIKMQITTWSFGRITAACAVAGAMMAAVAAFTIPRNYVSHAVIRMEGNDAAQNVYAVTPSVLGTGSLAEIIRRYDIYRRERSRMPIEDVVTQMQRRIVIKPMVRANGSVAAFSIEFAYPDPYMAQRVTTDLENRFIDANVRLSAKGTVLELIDPASLPVNPAGMSGVSITTAGLFAGMLIGMLVSLRNRPRRRHAEFCPTCGRAWALPDAAHPQ